MPDSDRYTGYQRQEGYWREAAASLKETARKAYPDMLFDIETISPLDSNPFAPTPGDEAFKDNNQLRYDYAKFYFRNQNLKKQADDFIKKLKDEELNLRNGIANDPSVKIDQR